MPCPIINQVFLDNQRDVAVSEIAGEIALDCSLDDRVAPGAVAAFLNARFGVFEISRSDLGEGFAGP